MSTRWGIRSILATCLPAAVAILVFGTLYGAAARAILGVPLALASSVFVFSGALQFALLALPREPRPCRCS